MQRKLNKTHTGQNFQLIILYSLQTAIHALVAIFIIFRPLYSIAFFVVFDNLPVILNFARKAGRLFRPWEQSTLVIQIKSEVRKTDLTISSSLDHITLFYLQGLTTSLPRRMYSNRGRLWEFGPCVVCWPSTRPNMPFPKWCTGRKWHIPMANNQKKSRRRIWDKVKAHDTLIDWCTGREWPLNCMTVISAWWRSNMPFQRLSGGLNYYITRWRQEVRVGDQSVGVNFW